MRSGHNHTSPVRGAVVPGIGRLESLPHGDMLPRHGRAGIDMEETMEQKQLLKRGDDDGLLTV